MPYLSIMRQASTCLPMQLMPDCCTVHSLFCSTNNIEDLKLKQQKHNCVSDISDIQYCTCINILWGKVYFCLFCLLVLVLFLFLGGGKSQCYGCRVGDSLKNRTCTTHCHFSFFHDGGSKQEERLKIVNDIFFSGWVQELVLWWGLNI